MAQGAISDSMHIITRGRVRVTKAHPDLTESLELAILGPGEVVGEMGVLDEAPRSATVTAMDEVDTLEIPGPLLAELVLRFPQATRRLLSITSQRIRSADELAVEIMRRGPWRRSGDRGADQDPS